MSSRTIAGLLGIAAVTLFANEAPAATCALRSSSGTCLFWTNGVEGDIVTDSQGSLKNGPKVDLQIVPTGAGMIACGNPGTNGWTSPGIQTVFVSNLTTVTTSLQGSMPIQKSNVSQGKASVVAHALAVNPNSSACPNSGWAVVDAVPCSATVRVKLSNDQGPIDSATFACSLDSCSSLAWDHVTQAFNRLPYSCVPTP